MTTRRRRWPVLLPACAAAAVLGFVPGASAAIAPGSLKCPTLSPYNNTHYGLGIGQTVTCTIEGATDVSNGPVDVFVKSTTFGNSTVQGSASGSVITFTYTAPSSGCATVVVAYETNGNNSNNDIVDDGVKNGSGTSAAGFAFLDPQGQNPQCRPTALAFAHLDADRVARGVLVRWHTRSELGVLGFNVYRESAGTRVKLNTNLVRAGSGLQGRAYNWLDRGGTRSTRYWLQAIDRSGASSWNGPVFAR